MTQIALEQGEQVPGTGGNRLAGTGARGVGVYVSTPPVPVLASRAVREGV